MVIVVNIIMSWISKYTNVRVSTDVPMRVKIHRYQYNNLFIIAININSHFQLFII